MNTNYNGNTALSASSSYTLEDKSVHVLAEYLLRQALGEDMSDVADIRENLDFYSAEMEQHAEKYKDFVLEALETAKHKCADPFIALGQRVEFGTCDAIIIADGSLHVINFRYDDTYAEVEDDTELKLCVLGALRLYDGLYDISNVARTLIQPKIRNAISTVTCFKESIYYWAEEVLKPTTTSMHTTQAV